MDNRIAKSLKIVNASGTEQTKCKFDISMLSATDAYDNVYEVRVDDEGNLYTFRKTEGESINPPEEGLAKEKLYINSFYCGGKSSDTEAINEHTLNYCSHNFVELANLTDKNIDLEGLTLQYGISGEDWTALPLKGVIKAGSTFLIRGAQCSMPNSPTTKIHVNTYDMEWFTNNNELMAFDNKQSAKFYLTVNLNRYNGTSPYDTSKSLPTKEAKGYVDLIGVSGTIAADAYENKPFNKNPLSNKYLYRKYYAMDPVSQATKAMNKRNNNNDWCAVDLSKDNGELIPNIEVYTPKASFQNKNLFYNKTGLDKNKPSMITCSFGIQATATDDKGATRCFNWLTGNLEDRFIWVRTKDSNTWNIVNGAESYYEGDNRTVHTFFGYNRIMKEYTGDAVVIANKYIVDNLAAGEYEYTAGRKNEDGSPKSGGCTEIRSFIVRSNTEVNDNIKFIQSSDQQGFNWEEYRLWSAAAKTIAKEYPDVQFMINTGDMTQNGNRLGEWLDYFNGKENFLNNMEEMATIGNNDLSLNVLYKIGLGGDSDKVWLENITLFFTFEADEDNLPVFRGGDGKDYYIPSLYSFNYGNVHFLCFNSEIKVIAETDATGYNFGANNYGNFYPQMKVWCENDMEKNSGYNWNIAYCHEMPFTILTTGATYAETIKQDARGGDSQPHGSFANVNVPDDDATGSHKYWFSEFCQTHNIPLVMGGHKHTQSTSWPILENVSYNAGVRSVQPMHPIIIVTASDLENYFDGATSLKEYNGFYYPNTWFNASDEVETAYLKKVQLCTFKMKNDVPADTTPVTYAMSQASAYKHTSNKELPADNIPWLRYSFGTTQGDTKSKAGQQFPFFTVWTIKNDKIEGEVRKVYGGFNGSGTFDINIEGPYVLKGKCAVANEHNIDIHSINGITDMTNAEAETDTRIIEIAK